METKTDTTCGPTRRKSTTKCVKVCAKDERNASLKKVSLILQKDEHERTIEEEQTLKEYSEIVADLKMRWQKRDAAKKRMEEIEEPEEALQEKCFALAKAIQNSEHLVVYTGAGISTAARIPDYRGTNGIWTRLQQGKEIENHDLSLAEPTFTHMALSDLYSRNVLKYVVSQNCDGLHLRSGLPRSALSELHGNMYIEVCKNCKPVKEYWRIFDVTENTARYSHKTMRRCYVCSKELTDTIVHFGERGTLQWPLNWKGACSNADKADTIICLGSSLKVLKRYPWLWQMNKPAKKRPCLFIVNLQWTPKDESAVLKIHGKCDVVMKNVMKYLGIEVPGYDRDKDPIFAHATFLMESEMHTTNQPHLKTEAIKNEIDDESSSECKSETMEVKEEEITEDVIVENDVKTDDFYEQTEAIDYSKNKNDKTVNNSSNCDNNTHLSIKTSRLSSNNGSSSSTSEDKHKTNVISNNSIFSIDSILDTSTNITPPNDYQKLMAYYELANTVLQNQMFGYLTHNFYPYQTSFLYPGLHSIINPMPFINYDFNCRDSQQSTSQQRIEVKPNCTFCKKIFDANVCLYYATTEPKFQKELQRFSKKDNCNKPLVCVCCDYTTEEEDDEESDSGEKKTKTDDADSKEDEGSNNESVSENVDQMNISNNRKIEGGKVVKVQAGWFGKGYRKNRRIKRR